MLHHAYIGTVIADVSLSCDQYESAESNTYTGDCLRAKKQFGSTSVYYVYDGDELVAELSGSGVATAAHTFGANGLVSRLTLLLFAFRKRQSFLFCPALFCRFRFPVSAYDHPHHAFRDSSPHLFHILA